MGEAGEARGPLPGGEPSFEYLRAWQVEKFGEKAIVYRGRTEDGASSGDAESAVNEAYRVGCWNGYMRGVDETSVTMLTQGSTAIRQSFAFGLGVGVVAACAVLLVIRTVWRTKPRA